MRATDATISKWCLWIQGAAVGVVAVGCIMLVAPATTRRVFSALAFADPARIDSLGTDAIAYASFVHAVLGAVMAGWGTTIFLIARRVFPCRPKDAWTIIVISLLVWFIPDSAVSLLLGFWPNALLNVVFLLIFAVPLAALHAAAYRGDS